jgi:cell division protein FtsB
MVVLREMRRRARLLVAPVLGIALAGYFAYHALEGERGVHAWFRVNQQLRDAKTNLAAIQAERAALDRKVANMRPDHVDPDLLDGQIRSKLDLGASNEIVVIQPRTTR